MACLPSLLPASQSRGGELLHVWMYGKLAHVNADKREVLQRWRVDRDIEPLFQYEFEAILVPVTQAIFWMRQVNLRAIEELRARENAIARADA